MNAARANFNRTLDAPFATLARSDARVGSSLASTSGMTLFAFGGLGLYLMLKGSVIAGTGLMMIGLFSGAFFDTSD